MYSLTNVIETGGARMLPVGTQMNVNLTEVELSQDANWTAMQLTFNKVTEEGEFVVSGRIFEPKGTYPRDKESKQDAIQREIREFNTKLRDIAVALEIPPHVIASISNTSFVGLVNDFKTLTKPYLSVPVCLKVVANKKNYPSLPNSGKFILPMRGLDPEFKFTFKDSEKVKDLDEGISDIETQLDL